MSSNQAPQLKTTERRGAKAVEKKASALSRLVVEYVDVDSIKPNDYNPNRQNESDFQITLAVYARGRIHAAYRGSARNS